MSRLFVANVGKKQKKKCAALLRDSDTVEEPSKVRLLGGLGATLLLRRLLYGITVPDPFAFIVTPLILGGSAYLACYFPARRAGRLDSLTLLRDQ